MTMEIACDLRSALPPVRDQGQRLTCLAFAMSDSHYQVADVEAPFSVDYLHYHACRIQSVGLDKAIGTAAARQALRESGQPLEEDCPYTRVCDLGWRPSCDGVSLWRRYSEDRYNDGVDGVVRALSEGKASVLGLTLSPGFYQPAIDGVVADADGDKRADHAVVAVAHGSIEGGDAILIRNSWGVGWGLDGHAWLTRDYLEKRVFEIVVMAEVAGG